jgi:urea transport system permease protein
MAGRRSQLLTAAIWLAFLLAPLCLNEWRVSQMAQLLTYGLFAMSLALIWGQAGILCFGQAIFFGVGAYIMALVTLGKIPLLGDSQGTGFAMAIVGGGLVALLLGLFMFRGQGLTGAHFAIVTLCASVIAEVGARRWNFIGGFNGLLGVPSLMSPFSRQDMFLSGTETYFLVLALTFVAYLFLLWLSRTPFGTLMLAIRSNENRTRFFGYDVTSLKLFLFIVSPPLVGFALSTEVLIWVAVGGRDVLLGAVIGAMLVRSVENTLSDALGEYWLLVTGILFVIVVVFAPRGLFGDLLRLPRKPGLGGNP